MTFDGLGGPLTAAEEIRALARPLGTPADLDPLVARAGDARFVAIGEASHGTHEFYAWRADLSRRLIEEAGFTWIGVEGDWPDCWRLDRWVRGLDDQGLDAASVLARFDRWPTWMWANREVADFLDWLHAVNLDRTERVGFYGLDVYSLWESLSEILGWLAAHRVDSLPAAMQAWQCFLPYQEDPQRYAWATRIVPEDCEDEVVGLLVEVRRRAHPTSRLDDEDFDVLQNAEVVAAAERYYRVMVRGDRESWNLRDIHMADTADRLAEHLGPDAKGLLWAHNTHVGDARATDMASAGMVNLGELLRRRHGTPDVVLVGFASSGGTVVAADAWGEPDRVMPVPEARPSSHEWLLHETLATPALFVFGADRSGPWLSRRLGHRAIGVVYDPAREHGNVVPTIMGARYDALLWCERTRALLPLHREARAAEAEYETEPTGF
ncbi:erythromycin esterase family protein [Agromyces aurantiacus]|uniref:Erythromycin esterase family protein n=1 Tax=Agromyces aurantiacus TaxID=165814 RepID=A0ABV9R1A9_9MICO|nr:erythromycin esterase family protein [Agromyces aurantiacus]MBM7502584.1 erythromycin esterase-like protein [Agromyces aurantiacus]